MKVTASNLRPTDIVKGVGILVSEVEPYSDYRTAVTGTVSTWNEEAGEFELDSATITLPNDHLVTIRRQWTDKEREAYEAEQFVALEDLAARMVAAGFDAKLVDEEPPF